MAKAVGIDLGTTNSVIAVWEGGEPKVVPNAEGARTTPSVVAFTESGERLVGQFARRQAILNPKGTIYSAKRFIGRHFDEVADEAKAVAFDVVGDDTAMPASRSAASSTRRRRSARWCCGSLPTTRPSTSARRSPRRSSPCRPTSTTPSARPPRTPAGSPGWRCCGSSTSRLRRRSPTGWTRREHETVMVFDLGGGTFDVSLLDVGDGVVEVRATAGDTHLGGDDFDRRLVDHLADDFQKDNGIDLRNDPQALQRLFEAAEKAKIELSSMSQTQVSLPFITADADGPKHLHHDDHALEVRADHRGPGGAVPGSGQAGDDRRQGDRGRHRRGDPRRRLDPDSGRAGTRTAA